MRVKLGKGRVEDDEDDKVSVPSAISEDMWGEIPKYQAMKEKEYQEKVKSDFLRKRDAVKATLDKQME